MKKLLYILFCFYFQGMAQVKIGTEPGNPHASAMLELQSTNRGLLAPRLTSTQRQGMAQPAIGLMVYDTDSGRLFLNSPTGWQAMALGNGSLWLPTGNHIYRPSGNVGIGIENPLERLHLRGTDLGTGNVIFEGQARLGGGPLNVQGSGTRMMWLSDYGAFRAGVQNDAFNMQPGKIGTVSVAFGIGNTASGTYAASWGSNNTASGLYATTWGLNNLASQSNSTAWGEETKAEGTHATAWGYYTIANGRNATAWGERNEATAEETTAWGGLTKAKGVRSTAWGSDNLANGEVSTVWGAGNTAFSGFETVLGLYAREYTPQTSVGWNTADRLLVVGNGTAANNRNNALTLMKNGRLGLGTDNPQLLLSLTDPGVGLDRPAENTLAFYTGNTERMRLTQGGRLCLGCDNPLYRVSIGSNNVGIDQSPANSLNFYTNGTGRMIISPTGNVAIGHNNPQLLFSFGDAGVGFNNPEFQNMSILTFGFERIRIKENGLVGIGTSDPHYRLSIRDPGIGFDRPATNVLTIHTNDEERMRFHANGNVSIGSTGSSDKLVIESEAEQSAFRVSVGGTTRLRVYGNGGVGVGSNMQSSPPPAGYLAVNQGIAIGTTDPAAYQLRLSQNSAAKPTSNTWTIFSDARLKKNIQPIESSLDRLLGLRGVTYQWRNPATQGNMAGTYTGLIAQEVEKVFPEWISENSEGLKQLTVIGFEGIVVEALRELREEKDKEIELLKDKIEKLEILLLQHINNSNDGK